MDNYRILVVDDDEAIRDAVEIYLRQENMQVLKAANGIEALRILEKEQVHLILMDIMMPRMDGMNATIKIREKLNIPIIMLSAKSEDTDKILGLNIGADDYVTKPFNPLELVARVKSNLRRYTALGNLNSPDAAETEDSSDEIVVRGLTLNTSTKTAFVNGEEVRLTPLEYKILELLILNKGRVFSIEEIYDRVWQEPAINANNTVAVHIRRIREKIEVNPQNPEYLKVVWGIGYKIER